MPEKNESESSGGPRRLPSFFKKETGLGDALKQATTYIGIKPCGGCARRAAALNNIAVFKARNG